MVYICALADLYVIVKLNHMAFLDAVAGGINTALVIALRNINSPKLQFILASLDIYFTMRLDVHYVQIYCKKLCI